MTPSRMLQFERLETRLALSGNVAVEVSKGILEVRGDKSGNVIDVRQIDVDSFEIIGHETLVHGRASFIAHGVQRGFSFGLSSGDDVVRFLGAIEVPGNLFIKGGNGGDVIEFQSVRVRGDSLLNLGKGNDRVHISDSTFERKAEFWFKHGNDTALIENSTVLDFFEFDMGEHNDTVDVVLSRFQGLAKIDVSDGQDTTTMNGATFDNTFTFVAKGPGSRSIEIANTLFRHDAVIRTGHGEESLNIDGATFEKSVLVELDAGTDSVELKNSVFHQSVSFDGGGGSDTFDFINGGNTFAAGQPLPRNFENLK